MSPIRIHRAAVIVLPALVLGACVSPPERMDSDAGALDLTTSPPGAWVVVRDCPTCTIELICRAPCDGPLPGRGLVGRYLSAKLDGYREPTPLLVSDANRTRFHFDLEPGTSQPPASPAATPSDAATGVVSVVRTAAYRSDITPASTTYEPMIAGTEFLVVRTQRPLSPGESARSGGDPVTQESPRASLLGPRPGRSRSAALTHRRIRADRVEEEHAFSVDLGENGPFTLALDGEQYALESPAADARPAPAPSPTPTAPSIEDRAMTTALAAVGATQVGPSGGVHLCARIERFELCGDRSCRPDGLMSRTTLACRESGCLAGEVPGAAVARFDALARCVAACRDAQGSASAATPSYCLQ